MIENQITIKTEDAEMLRQEMLNDLYINTNDIPFTISTPISFIDNEFNTLTEDEKEIIRIIRRIKNAE